MARTCASVNWCDIAWLPSRSVVSVMRTGRSVPVISATASAVATSSPTRAAAAVMMSRLPAYSGR